MVFAHRIKNNGRALVELKSYLCSVIPVDDITTESIQVEPTAQLDPVSKIDSTLNISPQIESTQDVYTLLRGRTKVKNKISESKYERLIFKYFFTWLLKTFKYFYFNLRNDAFRIQVNLNLKEFEIVIVDFEIINKINFISN